MAKVVFANEGEFEAEVTARIDAAIAELTAKHSAEMAALNALYEKAKEANQTADYSAFGEFPDLVAALKATDLRPGALPAISALRVWRGMTKASDIAKDIGITPVHGTQGNGGKPATAKIITAALQKLGKALISANTGVTVKVTALRGPDGDSTVKKVKFTPMTFADDESDAGESDAGETSEVEPSNTDIAA